MNGNVPSPHDRPIRRRVSDLEWRAGVRPRWHPDHEPIDPGRIHAAWQILWDADPLAVILGMRAAGAPHTPAAVAEVIGVHESEVARTMDQLPGPGGTS